MAGGTAFDAIVVGLGGMGSAAAYHLSRRGVRVLGLDANPRGHALGSSHGTSRIIRKSLYEAPEYVPLVLRAYDLWRELEAESGRTLLRLTGRVLMGAPDCRPVLGMLRSAREHGLAHEVLSAAEVRARFPGLSPDEDMVGVFEPDGGMLDPEGCIAAHLDLAAGRGAELRHGEPVLNWGPDGDGVRVETAAGTYTGGRLVLAPGAWLPEAAAALGLPLTVTRQTLVHFATSQPARHSAPNCPVFGLQTPGAQYYGTPISAGADFKIGQHDAGEACTPATVRREVSDAEVAHLRGVLDRYFPGAGGEATGRVVCLYTRTPDGHFVIDRHREHPQIAYLSACSGHGYKYCAVMGEIMADLALDGRTAHPIGFFRADRFRSVPA